ncbi:MAG: outer membrane beta-barrel protein [Elusimicrobia bacterium]|nr:outer membrane beta-barrel protein [Elusimicrobiota bacterium]
MNGGRLSFGCLLGAALLAAGPSWAQVGKWELGLSPTWALPTHHAGDYVRKSFDFQFAAMYQFHEWLSGGAELGYATGHPLGGKSTESDYDSPPDNRNDNLSFTSTAKLYWINFNPVLKVGKWVEFEELLYRPYIALGMGVYHAWYRPGENKLDGYTTKPAHLSEYHVSQRDTPSTGLGLNIGVGVDQQVFDFLTVGIDLRFHHIFNVADYDRDGTDDDDFDFMIPGLRFYYVF